MTKRLPFEGRAWLVQELRTVSVVKLSVNQVSLCLREFFLDFVEVGG